MTLAHKNIYWIIAGIISSFTTLVHLIAGQMDLVNPLLNSNLQLQAKTEWLAVWHIVSIILALSSYYLLKSGFSSEANRKPAVIEFIGISFILFSIVFIISSIWMKTLAPQWIILLPIGILSLIKKDHDN